jgi:photosystem II stability/assembly factor-like uncharacterized protein
VDASHAWAVGGNPDGTDPIILATSDGGATWREQRSGATRTLYGVAFADQWHGWAVGRDGTLAGTDDGGKTWREDSATGSDLWGVALGDADHGLAVGSGGTLLIGEKSGN